MKSKKNISIFYNLKTIFVFLLLFVTTGIASAGQTLDEVRNKWVGININKLIEKHGYPDKSIKAPNGNTVYIVIKNIKKFYPVPVLKQSERIDIDMYNTRTGAYSYGTTKSGGGLTIEHQLENRECAGYFEVDNENIIIDVKFKGDECPK